MADLTPDILAVTVRLPLPPGEGETPQQCRERLRALESASVDAALAAQIAKAHVRMARAAAGLPEEPDDVPAADRVVPVAARLGGGDGRGGGWTADRQRAFLGQLAETASVTHACRHVGLSKQSAYALRAREPNSVFALCWDVAVRMGKRRLWDEAIERAMAGRAVTVWHRGEEVGTRQVHNDRLLMFLLAHEPPAAHPVLDQRQLAELWPAMMAEVDAVLPPSLTPDRLAAMAPDGVANGNDGR